ncbi:MAG: hypothetical protein JST54_00240 [Deltaproteobacteria bacterium]|nr:hypothetical protein [Deltaproteobacteria bacterium]
MTRLRGKVLRDTGLAPVVMATVHPSSVLRAIDAEQRERERAQFFDDLQVLAAELGFSARGG